MKWINKLRWQSMAGVILLLLFLTACSTESNTFMNKEINNEPDKPILETPTIIPLPTNGDNKLVDDNEIIDDQIRWTNKELEFTLEGRIVDDGFLEFSKVKWSNKIIYSISWRNSALQQTPSVFVHDLNQDQLNELIVVTVLDHGSGVIVTEPHVLNSETLEEIPIESLVDIINENVSFEFENSKNSVVLNGDQVIFSDKTEDRKIEAKFDDWVSYTVLDGKLIGSVQIGDGSASGIRGYLSVTYKYETGIFAKDTIEFKENFPIGADPIPLTYSTSR